MKRNKAEEAEQLFQEGYALYRKEPEGTLSSDRQFLKPMEKSAKLGNPKASFVLGYLLCVGYKDLPVDIRRGSKILKKCFQPLNSLMDIYHDYLAAKFLSEYYRVPLAGFIKDDTKVKSLLSLAETYQNLNISPA